MPVGPPAVALASTAKVANSTEQVAHEIDPETEYGLGTIVMVRVIVVTRVGVSGNSLDHDSGGLLHFVKVSVLDAFDFRPGPSRVDAMHER